MKVCFKCGVEKELINFYKHKRMSDGHLNKCKECTKRDTKKTQEKILSDPDLKNKELSRHREKYHRLNYREKHRPSQEKKKEVMERWGDRFPEKLKASSYSQHLTPEFDGAEKHHWSYNDEHHKDVIWLSKKDHMKAHRFIVYDQERMMYRRCDNNILLDTKESHNDWIKFCISFQLD